VIDAHQHFWRLDRGDYGWLTPALGSIHRDFGPADLASVASLPQVSCKLSGLVTEARQDDGESELAPWIDAMLDLFGPNRLLWGSDWPVVDLAGGYDRWRGVTMASLRALDGSAREAVLGGNAERVYPLAR
jgi:L-fuconolactonase